VGYDESSFRNVIVMCRMMMTSTDRGRGHTRKSLWTRLFSKTQVPTHVYKSLVVPTLQKNHRIQT
jgi:predicted GNAT superfamily acetyltransferase